jgi:hypothetical protein
MRKRAHWIVFTAHTYHRIHTEPRGDVTEFYYLEYDAHILIYRWCADVKKAHRFTRPVALREAKIRGAQIDFHPDFRYAE